MPTLIFLESVTSTNSYLADIADETPPFTLVVSDNQIAGRGRLGRQWQTPYQKGLAFSLLVPPANMSASAFPSQGIVPLMAGACLLEALRAEGVDDAELKWPNDILVRGKKLAGVLCQAHPNGSIIVGIGMNILSVGDCGLPEAISLEECSLSDDAQAVGVMAELVTAIEVWAQSDVSRVLDFVRSRLATIGKKVEVTELDGSSWTGQATGLSSEGHLQVTRNRDGAAVSVVASDIRHLYQ